MAERTSRKSSILKLPKPSLRAPLQDVNTLDMNTLDTKSSQDDEMTSQTAHLRRRVSFHKKSFIKEFYSEADIASVHHAPVYERFTETSSLVTSDSSSNTHSCNSISENNSTVQTRIQTSVYESVSVPDDYDLCDELMLELKGTKPFKPQSQPTLKSRFSFGEIHIPSNPDEEGDAGLFSECAAKNGKQLYTTRDQSVVETTKTIETVRRQSTVECHSSSLVHSIQPTFEKVCAHIERGQTTQESGETTELNSACVRSEKMDGQSCAVGVNSANLKSSSQNICPDLFRTLAGPDVSTPLILSNCYSPPIDAVNKTIFDDSGMEFTKPITGIIECGIQLCLDDKNAPPSLLNNCCVGTGPSQGNTGGPAECKDLMVFAGVQADLADEVQPANATQSVNESMVFTTAVPGAIHIGPVESQAVEDNGPVPLSKGERVPDITVNKTIAMSTSMEFTRALPCNIEIDFDAGQDAPKNIQEQEINLPHSKMQMCSSMESAEALPANIQMDIEQDAAVEEEKIMHNHTQVMCTSMELTRAMPINIQAHFENSRSGVEVGGNANQENVLCNRTQAMCTSMELTKPLPSIIIWGDKESTTDQKEDKVMDASKGEWGNSQCNTEKCADEDGVEHVLLSNKTHVLCSSMDLTEVMPTNIECNLRCALDASKSFSKEQNLIPDFETEEMANRNRNESSTEKANPSLKTLDELSTNVDVNCALKHNEMVEKIAAPKCTLKSDIGRSVFGLENSVLDKSCRDTVSSEKDASKMQIEMMHVSRNIDVSGKEIWSSRSSHSNTSAPQSGEVLLSAESFTHVSDPFRCKTQLIVSPPTQHGIQGVLSQSNAEGSRTNCDFPDENVSKRIVLHSPTEIIDVSKSANSSMIEEQVTSKKYSTPDPFISKPCLAFSPTNIKKVEENANASQNVDKEEKQTRESLPLMTLLHEEKELSPRKGCNIPDSFKSMPRLVYSPVTQEKMGSVQGILSENKADGQACSNNFVAVGSQSPFYGEHCMLLDEPPPFNDVSSINMQEISTNLNDSGAHMLHTTIKNAEITLRLIHSPESEDVDSVSVDGHNFRSTPEKMDCNMVPSIPSNHTSSKLQSEVNSDLCQHDTTLSSILKNQITEQDSRSLTACNESAKELVVSFQTDVKKPSKRSRDMTLDGDNAECGMSDDSYSSKRVCKSKRDDVSVQSLKPPIVTVDLHLDLSDAQLSTNSTGSCSNASSSAALSGDLDLDNFILKNQMKHPQFWTADKQGDGLWSFKFPSTLLELKVCLRPSRIADEVVEGLDGHFISLGTESTKPIIRWAMDILMDQLNTEEWKSLLRHSPNFFSTMQKLVKLVASIRRFTVETIIQEKMQNLNITHHSLSFNIVSVKCVLLFKVTLKLDFWENYTPEHISVENIIGKTRELEVKNLITGVKKDLYFLRNYIRDIKDYVKTLEGCCE